MTDYAAILASNAGVAERAQQIADLFNVTPNQHLYTEFRLTHVSRAGKMDQHVFDMRKAQVDGVSLAKDIAATDVNAADADTSSLHSLFAGLQKTQCDNKSFLEKAATDIASLQEVFNVLVGAEEKMKGWSNVNLLNIRDTAAKLGTHAASVQEMTDALPLRDSMLADVEKSLAQADKGIAQRDQRFNVAAYLKGGIATSAAMHAPKTARFTRKPKGVQP